MIHDIIFQQHYAKKIDEHVQQVYQGAFTQGRQQGWNDILFILNELENNNIEATPEIIVESLKKLLAGAFMTQEEINKPESQQEQKIDNKTSHLSVIK